MIITVDRNIIILSSIYIGILIALLIYAYWLISQKMIKYDGKLA